jgi:hypothetical protein
VLEVEDVHTVGGADEQEAVVGVVENAIAIAIAR